MSSLSETADRAKGITIPVLIVLIGLSLVGRMVVAIALNDQLIGLPGTADQLSYHALGSRLIAGYGFSFDRPWWPATEAGAPTAAWSFLYTYFLASVYALFGASPLAVRLIQSVAIGILHPLLAYLLGRKVFGETAGLAAAGITAVYAYFAYYTVTLMTEPFYITVILATLYMAVRLVDRATEDHGTAWRLIRPAILLGVMLAIGVLLRQVFLLFVPVLLLWVWFASGRRLGWKALLPGIVVAMMVLPFTLYNSTRFDSFVLLNTNAGFAFFWANHPVYGTHFEPILPDEMGSYQELIPEELRGLDEAALDQELLRRGLGFIVEDPVRYVRLSLSRIPTYFMFWPSEQSSLISNVSRTFSFGLFLPFMIYGLVRAWIERGKAAFVEPIGLLTLFILFYSAIHLLSWALIRYRLPVDAVLVVFAGYALVDLAQRIGARRKHAAQPA